MSATQQKDIFCNQRDTCAYFGVDLGSCSTVHLVASPNLQQSDTGYKSGIFVAGVNFDFRLKAMMPFYKY